MADAGLVQKTLRLVQAVAANPAGIGLSGLARTTGIPKATCHRILLTLVDEGWVTLDPASKRFRTSLSLLLMLSTVSDRDTAFAYARQLLSGLAAETLETTGLDQRVGGTAVMVLAQAIGPHIVSLGQRAVPRMQPAWTTSTGKVFLAAADPAQVRQDLLADEGFRSSDRGRNVDGFLEELAATRERGYATAFDELEPGAASVACGVRINGTVPYAVWVGGPTYRLSPARVPEIAAQVARAAHDLERVLARTPNAMPDSLPLTYPQGTF